MNSLIVQLTLLQVGLPLVLILCNAFVVPASLWGLALRFISLLLILMLTLLSGIWLFPPWWSPYSLGLVHILCSLLAYRSFTIRSEQFSKRRTRVEIVIGLVFTSGLVYLLSAAIMGRIPPDNIVALAAPLESGRYLVTSGGTDPLINAHLKTLSAEHFRPYRGQSFAVDIIAIDELGLRADGISPQAPGAYYIYGKKILAPCTGTVLKSLDGVPDMTVPIMDRKHMLGNHVIIKCQDYVVVLAHIATATVTVVAGDSVEAGSVVGKVGNSGNTAEPHLHIHVQASLPKQHSISGQPIWFTLSGRFLVRNDVFIVPENSLACNKASLKKLGSPCG